MNITKVTTKDVPLLSQALRQLSDHMGDAHNLSDAELEMLLFGDGAAGFAMMAKVEGAVAGVVLCAPFISTTKGGAGLYVSDLWVAADMRGKGVGPQLMAAAIDEYPRDIKILRLAVYHDNPTAQKTYLRLGFKPENNAEYLSLNRSDFPNIRGNNESNL